MIKLLKNWRYWVLMGILFIALINALINPPENFSEKTLILIIVKINTIVLIWLDIQLFRFWLRNRKIDDIVNYIQEDK